MNRRARKPGRPPAEQGGDVRDRLLEAAAGLFARQGFASTSLRDLSEAAGVTPAMVSYYFGNKEGLYRALLERALGELLPALEAGGPAADLDGLVERLFLVATERLSAQPWIPSLLVREVLSEGGSFRDEFVERFASRVAGRVIEALTRAQDAGEVRAELDPRLAYLSLIGLVMFPLIGRPVIERILGLSFDDADFRTSLRRHGRRLFFEGVSAEPRP